MRARLALVPLLIASIAAPAAAQRLAYVAVADEGLAQPRRLEAAPVDADTPPDPGATAKARHWLRWGLLDRFEVAAQRGEDGFAWDFSALAGGKRNRLWLGSNGEGAAGKLPDYAEWDAFYSRNLGGPWDANIGLRYDTQSGADRGYGVLGFQYDNESDLWFGAWAYLSNKGEASARLAGYWDRPLWKDAPLILQPSAELDWYGEDVPELGLGRGLGYAEAGLRLRYEFLDGKLAPYAGLSWSRDLGRTARMTRAEGDDPETKSLVMGVRSSF
jgi:copper resistance protein B